MGYMGDFIIMIDLKPDSVYLRGTIAARPPRSHDIEAHGPRYKKHLIAASMGVFINDEP